MNTDYRCFRTGCSKSGT